MGLKLTLLCDISIDIVFRIVAIMRNTFQGEDKSSGDTKWRLHWTVVYILCFVSAPFPVFQICFKSALNLLSFWRVHVVDTI